MKKNSQLRKKPTITTIKLNGTNETVAAVDPQDTIDDILMMIRPHEPEGQNKIIMCVVEELLKDSRKRQLEARSEADRQAKNFEEVFHYFINIEKIMSEKERVR